MGLPDNVRPRAPFAARGASAPQGLSPRRYPYAGGGGRRSTRGTASYAVDEAVSVHLKSRSRQVAHCTQHEGCTRDPHKREGTGNDLTDTETMEGTTLCREVRGAAFEQLPLPRTKVLLGPAPPKLHDVLLVLDADVLGHGR